MTQAIAQLIKDAVKQYGDEDAVSFRNDYSGRGMYGEQCIGIVGNESDCLEIVKEVLKDAHSLGDDTIDFVYVVDSVLSYSSDSMGRSSIILYWPHIDPLEDSKGNFREGDDKM